MCVFNLINHSLSLIGASRSEDLFEAREDDLDPLLLLEGEDLFFLFGLSDDE